MIYFTETMPSNLQMNNEFYLSDLTPPPLSSQEIEIRTIYCYPKLYLET